MLQCLAHPIAHVAAVLLHRWNEYSLSIILKDAQPVPKAMLVEVHLSKLFSVWKLLPEDIMKLHSPCL